MIKFLEIPKNASRYSNMLNQLINTEEHIDVVFLRNPYERFWSSCKTIINDISFYGSYPPDGLPKITSYKDANIDIAKTINGALEMLDVKNLDIHLATQSSFIGDKKFDEVFMITEDLNNELATLQDKYNLTLVENFNFNFVINDSPHDIDAEALKYIKNTKVIKDKLDIFYKDDIALLMDINKIKK
jgi:hypothetical protein